MSSDVPLAPKAVDHTFRRKWDKSEFDAKANELGIKGVHDAALLLDEANKAAPVKAVTYEQDRGTATARTATLNLDEHVGERAEVQDAKRAGFYCAVCDRAEKDSSAWLDHLNSVRHQKNAGVSLRAERSTVTEVHDRLRELKRKAVHALAGDDDDDDHRDTAKSTLDDAAFEARLEKMRQTDEERLAEKRAKKRAKKKALRQQQRSGGAVVDNDNDNGNDNDDNDDDDDDAARAAEEDEEAAAMAAMMGLPTGFGSTKRH
jgi:U4/U6.U5 tri-snRNP component SNU23